MGIQHLPNILRQALAAKSASVAFVTVMADTLLDPELKNTVVKQLLNRLCWDDFF
jgi:hypothetical protein